MAKKVSKHSRAARRGEIDIVDGKAKDLQHVPRAEKTDTIGPMIRATAKNEELLKNKMEKKSLSKLSSSKRNKASNISKTTKFKQKRAITLDGRLSAKIEQSINRSRDVQSARKANWDLINKNAKESVKYFSTLNTSTADPEKLAKLKKAAAAKKTKKIKSGMSIDGQDDDDDWEDIEDEQETIKITKTVTQNAFALLGDLDE